MAKFKGGTDRDDVFVGTDASDRFMFDPADLTSGDTIVGGAGLDTLAFTAAGTITHTALANVTGIEKIVLAKGGNSIILAANLLTTSAEATLALIGADGADTIDASLLDTADGVGGTLRLNGGDGDDVIRGAAAASGQGFEIIQYVDGGAGADTIDLTASTMRVFVTYDPNDKTVAVASTSNWASATLVVSSAAEIDLGRREDQSIGDVAVLTGFSAVDASASREGVKLTADPTMISSLLIGGSGRDTIVGGTYIIGGRGADTLIGSDTQSTVTFVLAEGDFARGETITGRSGNDQLFVTGSVDLTIGTVTGINYLSVEPDANGPGRVTMTGSQAAELWAMTGNSVDSFVTVILGRGEALSHRFLHDTVVLDVVGSKGKDEVWFDSGYQFGTVNVHGGAGDDTIATRGDMFGDEGDDSIGGGLGLDRVIDGGAGNDTFTWWSDSGAPATIKINLGTHNQAPGQTSVLRGFENFHGGSAFDTTAFTVIGSADANRLTGGRASDSLSGGVGDDILDGGLGDDVLTGGAGADAFHWERYKDEWGDPVGVDTVRDFTPGEDRLEFDRSAFHVAGKAIDVRLVSDGGPMNLHDVDLLVYTGGRLASADDVIDLVQSGSGRTDNEGIFVVGENGSGETVLYYVPNSSFPYNLTLIADFGRGTDPQDLDVTNMLLV